MKLIAKSLAVGLLVSGASLINAQTINPAVDRPADQPPDQGITGVSMPATNAPQAIQVIDMIQMEGPVEIIEMTPILEMMPFEGPMEIIRIR